MTDDPLLEPARNLTEIRRLAGDLEQQALHRANARDFPGGEALAALAPVANIEAWTNQLATAEQRYADGNGPEPFVDDADREPPLQTLLFWTEQYRTATNTESDLRPTLESESAWLASSLSWIHDHEPHWGDFTSDIHAVRVRLEDIVHDGERLQAGAPCLFCRRPLIRITDPRTGGLSDDWRCPSCRRQYTADQYRNAVTAAYAALQIEAIGTTTWATIDRAAVEVHRSRHTIKAWVRDGLVRRACLLLGRRDVVSLDDVLDEDATRKRRARTVA